MRSCLTGGPQYPFIHHQHHFCLQDSQCPWSQRVSFAKDIASGMVSASVCVCHCGLVVSRSSPGFKSPLSHWVALGSVALSHKFIYKGMEEFFLSTLVGDWVTKMINHALLWAFIFRLKEGIKSWRGSGLSKAIEWAEVVCIWVQVTEGYVLLHTLVWSFHLPPLSETGSWAE